MPRQINLDIALISKFYITSDTSDRKSKIEARKQAIYQYRNDVLTQYLGEPIQNCHFNQNEFGKPFLKDYPNFSFNHSHSNEMYALASSDKIKDLGVDVEDLNRKVRFDALAQHAFHSDEYQRWQALENDPIYWFKVWTTKEAILKAHGMGIRMDLKDLNTNIHQTQNGGMTFHEKLGTFAFQNYEIADALITVAWRSEQSCRGFALPMIKIIQH